MKLFICFVLLLAFIFSPIISFSHAVSTEARHIKKDETWAGTISLLEDTIVDENATLIINKGTKVVFYITNPEKPARLIIKGKLLVNGTKEKNVIFTSSKEAFINPVEEEKNSIFKSAISFFAKEKKEEIKIWGGIHFENTVENRSEINYSVIEYAVDGIVCSNSSPKISYSAFSNCAESGIRCNLKSKPIISYNIFKNNSFSGIYCHQESAPIITFNLFQNLPCAIYCYQTAPKEISNNIFMQNKKGIYCQFGGASPSINKNEFNNNDEGIFCEQGATPIIENNKFNKNTKGIYLQRFSNPRIGKNIFNDNEFGVYCFQNSSPTIYNNKFISNKSGIFLNYASYPTIKENSLDESNIYAIKVGKQSFVLYQELMSGKGSANIGFGRYAPKNSGKMINQNKPSEQKKFEGVEQKINAKNNFWGIKILQEINKNNITNVSNIWDGYDEPEFEFENKKYPQDKVDYSNWLLEWKED